MDQSAPRAHQRPLTCVFAKNTRAFPPLSDREGGGKRPGTQRAFTDKCTAALGNSNRINAISAMFNALTGGTDLEAVDADQFARPDSDIGVHGSINPVGAATQWDCVNEEDADDEATEVVLAGNADYNCGLTNLTDPGKSGGHSIFFRFRSQQDVLEIDDTSAPGSDAATREADAIPPTGGGGTHPEPHTIELVLFQGVTQIATTGAIAHSNQYTGVWRDKIHTLSAAEANAITDYTDLRLKVIATSPGGTLTVGWEVTQEWMRITPVGEPSSERAQNLVLSCVKARCYVGDLDADTQTACVPDTDGPLNLTPVAIPFQNRWWVVDGGTEWIIDPTVGPPTIEAYTAEAGFGTAPTKCRSIAAYRDRIVQGGSEEDPTNWFAARVHYPRDYDYLNENAHGSANLAATYGSDPNVGQPGDIIVGLIPWGIDYLLFGCLASIYYLEGDPLYGGRCQNLSQKTGLIAPRAWCFDSRGRLWFLGNSGLFVLENSPGARPVNVSGRRLYRTLDRLDASSNQVDLTYDGFSDHIIITISPFELSEPPLHVVFDVPRDAFTCFDQFPLFAAPFSGCQIAGADPHDRRLLFGRDDGYISRYNDALVADDVKRNGTGGSSIFSEVMFAPVELPKGQNELLLTEMQAIGAKSAAPLDLPVGALHWWVWAADSGSETELAVAEDEAVDEGDWFEDGYGFQEPVGLRVAGAVHQLFVRQVSKTASWALERVTQTFEVTGRRGR